jgi:hypothetical protein
MPSALPGYRVFALCGAAAICSEELTTASSLGLTPSYRVLRAPNGRCRHSHSEEQRSNNSTSLEVSSPSASPRSGQRHLDRPSKPAACACRFSQPLGAFIRPEPGGLVSCRIRSWGGTLQSLAPPVQPYAVSSANTLLSFENRRTKLRQSTPGAEALDKDRQWELASTASPPSGSCSARESACTTRPEDRTALRSSPGLDALQGFPPRWLGTAFTAPPLTRLVGAAASDRNNRHLRVCTPAGWACLRRDRLPSWASSPFDSSTTLGSAAVRESPPGAPGCVTVPWSSLL